MIRNCQADLLPTLSSRDFPDSLGPRPPWACLTSILRVPDMDKAQKAPALEARKRAARKAAATRNARQKLSEPYPPSGVGEEQAPARPVQRGNAPRLGVFFRANQVAGHRQDPRQSRCCGSSHSGLFILLPHYFHARARVPDMNRSVVRAVRAVRGCCEPT